MADLLSQAVRDQIRLALGDVTDTFCKTPITWIKRSEVNSRFGEDNASGTEQTYNLLGFVEYGDQETDEVYTKDGGKLDKGSVEILMNYAAIEAAGLGNADNLTEMVAERDKFICNGEKFECTFVKIEGAFEAKNILVIVRGERDEKV